ncbi:hypothetical protein HPC49_20775 [Pyxidicoccus fallax]|uniref:Uncharacterized protein n=1 Tax=Pyxidicoccus fallax TaxID=394095 RepID=A0A848LH66_9BACT|nr:hypothetical protein [Pyxidicoccus fallax]NMO15648.1 hypothetical protein [Pyxidicoccus fallax]NPC80647.1 hypothetical protein [Pyxidicoccus fallax]
MSLSPRAVWLRAAVSLSACGGLEESQQPSPEAGAVDEQASALLNGTSNGCGFAIDKFNVPLSPPYYNIYLRRSASATCAYAAAQQVIGVSYTNPPISLAANDLGVVTSYSYKYSPSGSANIQCMVRQYDPATMALVREHSIVVMYGAGNVTDCQVSINSDGTTVTVRGTKTGPLMGSCCSPGPGAIACDLHA